MALLRVQAWLPRLTSYCKTGIESCNASTKFDFARFKARAGDVNSIGKQREDVSWLFASQAEAIPERRLTLIVILITEQCATSTR
jgi:hypothetical protein